SFTVSDETLREAGALARELGVGVHVHIAEDAADVEDAKRRGYVGVLERLVELDALPKGSILAHGVHLSKSQVRRADEAGHWFVQNPRSNEGNRVGYAATLAASEHVALGTDGYPANMGDELAALARLAGANDDPIDTGGRRSRADAGRALAEQLWGQPMSEDVVQDDDGSAPGKIVQVVQVVVDGTAVVEDGKLVRADLEEIRADAKAQAAPLWERMNAL
ncbi:MAG: amidohydrolase family protein, partial [Deltaproteobacteria bacterium]|nr:amidohydrolase family protein [Deltaproteobacteria bacterium]